MSYDVEEHGEQGRVRHGSPTFYKLLQEMAELHDRKSHDYASDNNPSGNYHFAGRLALLFAHSEQDAGFVGRLGEKIYRLANLEGSQKIPQNEGIEDTERDICVITALWMADRRDRRLSQNRREMSSFTEGSREIRDAFVRMAGQLTPYDKEFIMNYLRDSLSIAHGITGGAEYKSPHPSK